MTVNVSFPGIYIEELPLSAHTIAPAPTSIAAFVGYTHPLRTTAGFKNAIELFSFTDYENQFGGLYTSGIFDSNVARAVFQFFQNGGSHAWVVGLQPQLRDAGGTPLPGGFSFTATVPTQPAGNGLVFTAQEPTDQVPMNVSISNLRASSPVPGAPLDMFDVIITYGPRIETFRGVAINGHPSLAPDAKINDKTSTLVTVAPPAGNGFGSSVAANITVPVSITLPAGFATTFSPQDFVDVFEVDSSLDKVEIFNLLLVPGVAD